ncbi:unnamed protein product [Echinostoma caproni]|uniref:Ras-associating domain-containing protein n=1 Tax=Echinostoma caproni TaxID=27848 RepID=A0A183AT02_9TREM|nr:unnamed protein product [Echinostoma caproni]
MSTYSAVKQCLKTFHLAGTPDFYNVYEVNDRDGRENKLNANANFRSQLRFDVKQPSIVLRAKEPEETVFSVKIYAGDLGYMLPQNASDHETVVITTSTTSADAVAAALEKFGCGHLGAEDCYLSTVCTDRVVTERRLSSHELLAALLSQLRHESSRTAQLTRFELRFTDESPAAHPVSVFVGNLKENLSQRLYECILLEKLGESCRWDTIDAIYYESGCLVLTYRSSEKAEHAYELLKVSQQSFEFADFVWYIYLISSVVFMVLFVRNGLRLKSEEEGEEEFLPKKAIESAFDPAFFVLVSNCLYAVA